MHWLTKYLQDIRAVEQTRADTEMSYRPAISELLTATAADLIDDKLTILHEPQRQAVAGAPDYRIQNSGGGVVGYLECKAPGADLRTLVKGSEQVEKYKNLSPNIMLTDSWHWLLLRNGKVIKEAHLSQGKITASEREDFAEFLRLFLSHKAESIGDAKRLAAALAARCKILCDLLVGKIENDKGKLKALYAEFRKLVYRNMEDAQFADAFAQTTTYSLFMARLQAGSGEKLNLYSVEKHIPQTFALIRELSGFLRELNASNYKDLDFAVDDILAVINNMDVAAVAETMAQTQKAGLTDEDDPFMLFYENFLAAYNKALRKSRGVYYTPLPVVRFIVRAVDDILKNDFKITDGLAGGEVTSLDFAAGTGTFVLENMRKALEGKTPIEQKVFIKDRLLRNCHGFEYLIASYVIAHLKLLSFLEGAGHQFDKEQVEKQLKIYLTDTLEQNLYVQGEFSFVPALAEETRLAQEVKEETVLVVMGNPPYSGHSQTASKIVGKRPHKKNPEKLVKDPKDTWIGRLLKDYYKINNEPLGEKNTKWLQDDYVKFIRFAQHKMENADRGIVAVITNHSFLDNPTFRGMRNSLLNAFNRLYFLDLHGNSSRKETAPDGGKDENVFDIKTGVCISLLVKNPNLSRGVYHYDLYGKRQEKYGFCQEGSVASIEWNEIKPAKDFYVLKPHSQDLAEEYGRHPSLPSIFPTNNVGLVSARDKLTIAFSEEEIRERAKAFSEMEIEKAREIFSLGSDTKEWSVEKAQKDLTESGLTDKNFQRIAYRPFDTRHTYYTGKSNGFHCRPRSDIMSHIADIKGNIGLVSVRQVAEQHFNHVFAVDAIMESRMTLSNKGIAYLFPLYLAERSADGKTKESENINLKIRQKIEERYGKAISAKNIMFYVYTVLHSSAYRKRYADFLRLDYPRIPFPKKFDDFNKLAKIGGELMSAHLLRRVPQKLRVDLHGDDSLKVESVKLTGDKLRINKNAYFAPVPPEVFDFMMCGYRPLDKYLKAREGRELTADDVDNVKAIVNAVQFTIDQMKEMPELEYGAGWKE